MSLVVTDCAEQLEGGLEIILDLTDRSQVSAAVAVVRSAPHGDDVLIGEMVFIALVHELVCTGNEREVVDVTELIGHPVTEQPSYIAAC